MLQSRRSSSYFVPLIVGHISKWWPNFELCQIFVLQAPLMSRCINTNSAHQKIFSLLCKCIYETALTLVSVTLWNSCYNISYEAPLKYHISFLWPPDKVFHEGCQILRLTNSDPHHCLSTQPIVSHRPSCQLTISFGQSWLAKWHNKIKIFCMKPLHFDRLTDQLKFWSTAKEKEVTHSSFVQMVLLYPFFTHFFSNKRKCIRNIFNEPLYHFLQFVG